MKNEFQANNSLYSSYDDKACLKRRREALKRIHTLDERIQARRKKVAQEERIAVLVRVLVGAVVVVGSWLLWGVVI